MILPYVSPFYFSKCLANGHAFQTALSKEEPRHLISLTCNFRGESHHRLPFKSKLLLSTLSFHPSSPFSNRIKAVGSYRLKNEVCTEKEGKQECFKNKL